jgi:hypothetical protein
MPSGCVFRPAWFLDEDISDVPEKEVRPLLHPKTKQESRVEIVGFPFFVHQWEPILTAAGAMVTKERLSKEGSNIHFILSDSNPTELTIEQAKTRKLPLCNTEWVIQCLIERKLLDPLSNPALTHDLENLPGAEY